MGRIRASSEWADKEEKIKSMLRNYRYYVSKYNATLALYENMYPSITGQIKDVVSFGCGGNSSEDKMMNILDHRAHCRADLERQREHISNIERVVDGLPPRESIVILHYHMMQDRRSMPDICEDETIWGRNNAISIETGWRLLRKGIRRLMDKVTVNDSDIQFLG